MIVATARHPPTATGPIGSTNQQRQRPHPPSNRGHQGNKHAPSTGTDNTSHRRLCPTATATLGEVTGNPGCWNLRNGCLAIWLRPGAPPRVSSLCVRLDRWGDCSMGRRAAKTQQMEGVRVVRPGRAGPPVAGVDQLGVRVAGRRSGRAGVPGDRAGHAAGSTSSGWIDRHRRWMRDRPVSIGTPWTGETAATRRLPVVGRCRARWLPTPEPAR
jgi:hypothetical protein